VAKKQSHARKSGVPFTLGVVGHFGLAVRDPRKSAKWWERALGLEKQFEFDGGIAVGNDNITIALHKGNPAPQTFDHMSFHLPNMTELRRALVHLQSIDAEIEDPGDEIGPEAQSSEHMGLWFHDPDGYRWELSVQGGRLHGRGKSSVRRELQQVINFDKPDANRVVFAA
jgi:catechol 2,3-dioxygenase-like lactoylglutathione lyase family enzyme